MALDYDAFVEATIRLAAIGSGRAAGSSPLPAKAAAQAAAAAAVVAPSPTRLSQPIAEIDEAAVMARLPILLARQLLAVLPDDGASSLDLSLAAIENAAIARARSGEVDESLREQLQRDAHAHPRVAAALDGAGDSSSMFSA
jgi:hypothetical protein